MQKTCPCGSGKSYADCCKIWHDGGNAPNALLLMRSRYSAYALHNAHYIIRTTHPTNPIYQTDQIQWSKEILDFCRQTKFIKLEIQEFIDGEREAYVTFVAHLWQHHAPFQLIEKSRFIKDDNQWLYCDGLFFPTC